MAKALNKNNLLALGPERLAELLLEVTKGRADMQRRLRLELSAHQGADDVAHDIRKRYASIRQAKGYLSRKTHRTFAKEIRSLITLIEQGVAQNDANLAFELLWELLHLAPGVLGRTRDAGEILAEAFSDAVAAVAHVAPKISLDAATLGETIFDARSHDAGGTFLGVVAALAPALGDIGLDHLKSLASASTPRHHRLDMLLREVADAQGNVDDYIARFTSVQMKQPAVVVDIAARLSAAGRTEEALQIVRAAMDGTDSRQVADAYIACLEAIGRKDELRDFLWRSFRQRPDADRLRKYLRLLPDFDDIEAEDEARAIAADHADAHAALRFFVDRSDLTEAAALVLARSGGLDGNIPDLAACAEALEGGYPLASVLIRRRIISSLLRNGSAADDRRAADQLKACATTDMIIPDYGDFPDHISFLEKLGRAHRGRRAFWSRIGH